MAIDTENRRMSAVHVYMPFTFRPATISPTGTDSAASRIQIAGFYSGLTGVAPAPAVSALPRRGGSGRFGESGRRRLIELLAKRYLERPVEQLVREAVDEVESELQEVRVERAIALAPGFIPQMGARIAELDARIEALENRRQLLLLLLYITVEDVF